MNTQRIVVAQFCDDIRREIGNKYSLIGCYSDELIVDKFPAVLPKLCAQIRAITTLDQPFKRLIFRAFLNDEQFAQIEIPQQDLVKGTEIVQRRPFAMRISLIAMMQFSPFPFSQESQLRVEAETEDGIVPGSFLVLRERKPEDPAQ